MMMLTVELLIYLSMLILSEPQIFETMIRIRIGLIIQVMIGELKRTLMCNGIEQNLHLINLKCLNLSRKCFHTYTTLIYAVYA